MRWVEVIDLFIDDQPAAWAWDDLLDTRYAQGNRTNEHLMDDMIANFKEGVLRATDYTEQVYIYLQNLTWRFNKYDITHWTNRIKLLYVYADMMKSLSSLPNLKEYC